MTSVTRIEKDDMGEMTVPATTYWGAQTQRAVENFPISGYRFGRRLIRALGLIKHSAAKVNRDLGRLDAALADLIVEAAQEANPCGSRDRVVFLWKWAGELAVVTVV